MHITESIGFIALRARDIACAVADGRHRRRYLGAMEAIEHSWSDRGWSL